MVAILNEQMYALGAEPSDIRELFAYGLARKAQIGQNKVFDFSLGNPNVPAPHAVKQALLHLSETPACQLHGYTPAAGALDVRQAVASNITRRFGIAASADNVYMTSGAAAGLAISLRAITQPGEEVVVIAPFFPEYPIWINAAGCTCRPVAARAHDFQLDIPSLQKAIGPQTTAIIINSPNNPVGAVYTRQNLQELSKLLHAKEEEFARKIYLISDEPYREIAYGVEVSFVPCLYPRSIVCYSYSKSLSLPGERIGYVYVSDVADDAQEVCLAVAGAGRALGYVCAPTLFQEVVKQCIDELPNLALYSRNRRVLTRGLKRLGYEFVEPQGAFYLWVRALEPDARRFSRCAQSYELLLVPSNSFGMEGWVRISYCVALETIVQSLPAFRALMQLYTAKVCQS